MKNHGWLFNLVKHLFHSALPLLFISLHHGVYADIKQVTTDHHGLLEVGQLRYALAADNSIGPLSSTAQLTSLSWHMAPSGALNLGYDTQSVWLHLRLHNTSAAAQTRLLEIAYPALDDITIWVFADDHLRDTHRIGDRYPYSESAIRHRNPTVVLKLAHGDTLDIVLRVRSASSLQIPLALWSPEELSGIVTTQYLLMGIYYGSLLVMLLYNLSIYINGRDIKYLWYVTYLASIGLLFATVNGLGLRYFWPDVPHLDNSILIGSLGCSLLFASLFANAFLSLANTRPLCNRAMQLVTATALVIICAGALLPYSWIIQPTIGLAMIAAVVTLACSIARWQDGNKAAKLFTLSWLALLTGGILLGLSLLGWLPRNAITAHTAQIGSMIEFMLFSLALIKQLNTERRAKFAAQRSALNFAQQASESRQHALELQRQTTEELELRVHQRTLELQALNEKLRALSTTDPLTGMNNRRYFNERFHAEFSRSKRDGTPVSVIIIDVDHFKAVNDNHGHLVGDELLKVVATNISAQAKRESDIIARHGGEEFSAVLINNTASEALAMAEKIRRRIARASYQAEHVSVQCTVSIGVATMVPQKHNVAEELLKQADDALYQSKANGRNRVSVFRREAA